MQDHTDTEAGPKRRRSVLFWVLAGLLVAAFVVYREALGPGLSEQGASHPAVGRPLPTLQLQGLTPGAKAVTLADLNGKVVLVNFWGTWCGPCLIELPHIVELDQQFGMRKDFRLLAVSCGTQGGAENLEELRKTTTDFLEKQQLKMPAYADLDGTTRGALVAVAEMDRFAYPTTVLLDRDGVIRAVWVGYRWGTEDDMERMILGALEQTK